MELSTRYDAQEAENRWYGYWMQKGYFRSTPDAREPFTVLIPPPNVTGVLHMGHMLNNTIQDILIRKARLEGKNACWVPGTDHASIATEAKVVKLLREQGIKKSDISREAFLEHAFEWKDKYGGIILDQLKMLGASCDWDRTRFTMEPKLSAAVIKVFVDLYKKGYIYRGLRMTNWDCEAKTVLSNEEVLYSEENSRLYHVRYQVEGTDEWITIATQRPETIMADTGLAVNPSDERYKHLHGKRVIVPLVNRAVPIITDHYVDVEFGTGALKVTPAHDPNDYELGRKYGLEVIDTINLDGTLNEKAQFCVGQDRFKARKNIAKLLEEQGYLVKTTDYTTRVGRSERTNSVVEPKLTEQWFVKMGDFARTALQAVESGEVKFYPADMMGMYRTWLDPDNIRDWCISRQLWWGQRIPAFYAPDGRFAVAETAEEALEILNKEAEDWNVLAEKEYENGHFAPREKKALLTIDQLHQDEDVVDTWFSSWLWPLSVFDAFEDGDRSEAQYYYPTSVLVTGWDIIFFWVARMIMAGYEWSSDLLGKEVTDKKGKFPFHTVYFTGMVRDKMRRKMSKSLGNSPDAIELIKKYGADGVRFGMLLCASAGNDVIFDAPFEDEKCTKIKDESKLCEMGRNFSNKLWNALRLVKGWEVVDKEQDAINKLAIEWFEHKINQTIEQLDKGFQEYRLSENLMLLYNFVWDDFCSWYLEMVKPAYQTPIDRATYEATISIFERLMTLMHPFMPFITEEVWANLRERAAGEDCIASSWLKASAYDAEFIRNVETMKAVVSGVREVRNQNQLTPKELLQLFVKNTASSQQFLSIAGMKDMILKMAFVSELSFADDSTDGVQFLAGTEQYTVVFEKKINAEEERAKLQKELDYLLGFVESVGKKLSNERFVQNAKPEIVETERRKLADGEAKIALLQESLAKL